MNTSYYGRMDDDVPRRSMAENEKEHRNRIRYAMTMRRSVWNRSPSPPSNKADKKKKENGDRGSTVVKSMGVGATFKHDEFGRDVYDRASKNEKTHPRSTADKERPTAPLQTVVIDQCQSQNLIQAQIPHLLKILVRTAPVKAVLIVALRRGTSRGSDEDIAVNTAGAKEKPKVRTKEKAKARANQLRTQVWRAGKGGIHHRIVLVTTMPRRTESELMTHRFRQLQWICHLLTASSMSSTPMRLPGSAWMFKEFHRIMLLFIITNSTAMTMMMTWDRSPWFNLKNMQRTRSSLTEEL